MKEMKEKTHFIDGDSLLYKIECAVQNRTYFEGETAVSYPEDKVVIAHIEASVKLFVENLSHNIGDDSLDDCVFFIGVDGRKNWRYTILPSYKHNRRDSTPLLWKDYVILELSKYIKVIIVEELEVDEVLVSNLNGREDKTIYAIDKDVLNQCWGCKRSTYSLTEKDWIQLPPITKEEGLKYSVYQALVGDTSDGYRGYPLIGAKKAEAILLDRTFSTTPIKVVEQIIGLFASGVLPNTYKNLSKHYDLDKLAPYFDKYGNSEALSPEMLTLVNMTIRHHMVANMWHIDVPLNNKKLLPVYCSKILEQLSKVMIGKNPYLLLLPFEWVEELSEAELEITPKEIFVKKGLK